MMARLGQLCLALALTAAIGWPALATVLAARAGEAVEGGAPPLGPVPSWGQSGGLGRPAALAVETVRLVAATEAIGLPLGVPLALLLFRTDLWGRRGLLGLLVLSAFVPLPLHATAWLGSFGNMGRAQAFGLAPILVGWQGAAFVHAMAALPWIVVLAGVGFRAVEPELEEAALLDLPSWGVLGRVTVRRGIGGVAGAALAVAVVTAGDMTVTDLLQVRTYAEEAYVQFSLTHEPGAAAAVSLPPLLVLGGLLLAGAGGLLRTDPARLASAVTGGKLWRLGAWRVPLGLLTCLMLGALVGLPIYGLVWRAGRVGGSAALGQGPHWSLPGLVGTLRFAGAETIRPLVESAMLATTGASATAATAWGLAWVSRRPGPWRWVVALVVAVSLAAPGPVAGMALLSAYRPFPALYDSAMMIVLADMLRTLPYALLVLWPAVRTIPPELLEAAAVDGYGPAGQVGRVALPMTRAALLAAWGVAFVLALGELPATNIVTPPGLTPMSVVLWSLLHTGVESHLAGVALFMLLATGVAGSLVAWACGPLWRGGRS